MYYSIIVYIITLCGDTMNMYIIAVGHKMPIWVKQGYQEYAKRFPKNHPVQLIELAHQKLVAQKIPLHSHVVALHEKGIVWSSIELSHQITAWQALGKNIVFLIGDAQGLSAELLKQSHQQWSLSRLTFPHMLVRMILIEQLYRGLSILANHPYHKP